MDSQVVGTIITATSVFLASAVSAGTINLSRNVKQITKEMKEGFDRLENYHAKLMRKDLVRIMYKYNL
jgi:GTP cyclohydrolase FolE2